jgi:ribosomal protein S18 acetylase RimI-like enzyme
MTPAGAGMQLGSVTADDLRATFRGDVYGEAATMTQTWFADHVARNDVDLARSPRWTAGGELSGAALLAFRGDRAWVGGFGVAPAFRGRGLAQRYLAELLALARGSGATTIELEVIAHNAPAVALYRRGGFETAGELVAWSRDPNADEARTAGSNADEARSDGPRAYDEDAVAAIARRPPTCWQREPRSVAVASPSELVVVRDCGEISAYAFVRRNDDPTRASLLDAGARGSVAAANALLAELDRRFPDRALMLINEPPDGALHDALQGSPRWHEFARQFLMRTAL